jgi:hypothetical protein
VTGDESATTRLAAHAPSPTDGRRPGRFGGAGRAGLRGGWEGGAAATAELCVRDGEGVAQILYRFVGLRRRGEKKRLAKRFIFFSTFYNRPSESTNVSGGKLYEKNVLALCRIYVRI